MENAKKNNSALHLMGLFSDGGVHSSEEHLYALLEMANKNGIEKVNVHALLDGRDVPPRSAKKYFDDFNKKSREIGVGQIVSITGRYYAMDRDNRWDRVEKAYMMFTGAQGFTASSEYEALEMAYNDRDEDDEFVQPTIINKEATVSDGDSIIFFNFRPDRAREITRAFTARDFEHFRRDPEPNVHYVCMTEYDKSFNLPVAYPKKDIVNTFAEVLSNNNLKQLHLAETEKYAHVTFFFNGGKEEPFEGEDRILVNSPSVATYDKKPEMSAYEVTDKVIEALDSDKYDVIILNYANADMVGHTGVFEAAVKAIESVDECVGRVVTKAREKDFAALITADHGNSDNMLNEQGDIVTAHSLNKVPFICITDDQNIKLRDDGVLGDVTATALELLDIQAPAEMDCRSLIIR
jgi:2,3-bisphosphoglycerate-independent phosphoglycerate mutase